MAGLVVAAGITAGAGRAAAGDQLAIGQAARLATAGVALRAPADGRVNGFDFTGQVVGSECGPAAGTGDETVTAAPGGQVCVFALHLTKEGSLTQPTGAPAFPPTVTVKSGTATIPVPITPDTVGSDQPGAQAGGTFAVGVAAGAPATLVVAQNGFAQAFDLRAGKRIGPSPTVLYRNGPASTTVVFPSAAPLLTSTRSDTGEQVTWSVKLTQVTLSYFAPDQTAAAGTPAPGVDQAYLTVVPSMITTDPNNDIGAVPALPGSDVHLALPDGRSLSATAGTANVNDNGDLLNNIYYFLVPADIDTATFEINVAPPGEPIPGGDVPLTLAFTGTAKVPLQLGPPHVRLTPTLIPPRHHPASGGSPLIWAVLAIAAVVIVAGGLVFARRATRHAPARPVIGFPPALLAATPGEIARGPDMAAIGAAPAELGPAPPSANGSTQADGEAPGGPVLVVRVLGPLDIEGLTRTIRRKAVVRVLVSLALAPERTVSVEELRDAIATDPDRPPAAETVHTTVSRLRTHLPAGMVPPVGPGGDGYRLAEGVTLDWALFGELTARAANCDDTEHLELSCRALSLVRGVPLDHGSWAGVDRWVRHIETTIEAAASDTARLALTLRDARTAELAISQGLLAAPDSPALHELRLVAAAGGSGVGLDRAWGQTCEALGSDAEPLAVTYERLRAGSY